MAWYLSVGACRNLQVLGPKQSGLGRPLVQIFADPRSCRSPAPEPDIHRETRRAVTWGKGPSKLHSARSGAATGIGRQRRGRCRIVPEMERGNFRNLNGRGFQTVQLGGAPAECRGQRELERKGSASSHLLKGRRRTSARAEVAMFCSSGREPFRSVFLV